MNQSMSVESIMETNPVNITIKAEEPFFNQLIRVFTWEQQRISLICKEYCQNESVDPVIFSSLKDYENNIKQYQRMINQIRRQLQRQKAMDKSQNTTAN